MVIARAGQRSRIVRVLTPPPAPGQTAESLQRTHDHDERIHAGLEQHGWHRLQHRLMPVCASTQYPNSEGRSRTSARDRVERRQHAGGIATRIGVALGPLPGLDVENRAT